MRPIGILAFVVPLLLPAASLAKGVTARITITDVQVGASTDITDPSVLERFSVWAGRGTFVSIQGRKTEGMDGFIIDWPAGAASTPSIELRRYEVRFFVHVPRAAERLAYVVFYVYDPRARHGFVYLPGRSDEQYALNVRTIFRGSSLEGSWFRATRDWDETAGRALTRLRLR